VDTQAYRNDFAAFYKGLNASGKMDAFFLEPENFAYASNDFGAAKLALAAMSGSMSPEARAVAEQVAALCDQALDEAVDSALPSRPEWEIILGLLKVIRAGLAKS
jgi:hypothetical protein